MSKSYFTLIIILFSFCFYACEKPEEYAINSEQDLIELFNQDYIKVHFKSQEFKQESCSNYTFKFEDVKVIKISESEFKSLISQLKVQKLDPLQVDSQFDLSIESQGVKYCLNNLGHIYRNNRKLNDNPDLVYDIKTDVGFYNYFDEKVLLKNDSVISKKGLPFSYKLYKPEISGELMEDNTINKKINNLITSHNIVLTFK